MTMKPRGHIALAVSLLIAAAALVFSPALAAAEGCTITCATCYIDDKTMIAHCENCTFRCTTAIQ